MMQYTHFLYVTKYSIFTNDYQTFVYGVVTKDIFHTMGEIMYRSETHVQRITFVKLTPENIQSKLDFFKEHNLPIRHWKDKYE